MGKGRDRRKRKEKRQERTKLKDQYTIVRPIVDSIREVIQSVDWVEPSEEIFEDENEMVSA